MPDPRVEEGSSSAFVEQQQEEQCELYDLPSTLEYKDQGRDYQQFMSHRPTGMVEAVPSSSVGHYHLPPDLHYKDQGRDYQDVLVPDAVAVPETRVTGGGGAPMRDLPSNLDYKDQGRDMSSVFPQSSPVAGGSPMRDLPSNLDYKDQARNMSSVFPQISPVEGGSPMRDLPSYLEYKDQARNFGSIMPQSVTAPSSGRPPKGEEMNDIPQDDRKRRCVYYVGGALIVVLAIVVGVAVAVVTGSRGKSEASRVDVTATPSASPAVNTLTPSAFDPSDSPSLSPTATPLLWSFSSDPILGETVNEFFGFAVDLSKDDGSILAAGAYRYNVPGGLNGFDAGQVRIFRRNGDKWDSIGRINGTLPSENYGWAVALSHNGTIMAHGTPYTDNEDGDRIGSVVVYRFSEPDVWTPMGNPLGNATPFSDMGFAVDLSEDGTICALSYNGDDSLLPNSGSFEVYRYDSVSDDWKLMGDKVYGDEDSDFFGYSLRLNYAGDIVASGAGAPPRESYVEVYRFSDVQQSWEIMGGTIRATLEDDRFNGNYFGAALALSANGLTVVVGAIHEIGSGRPGFVQVFRFDENANQWEPFGQVIRGQTNNELFGYSVVSVSERGCENVSRCITLMKSVVHAGYLCGWNCYHDRRKSIQRPCRARGVSPIQQHPLEPTGKQHYRRLGK